jgi:PBP/GOBP family
VRAEDTLDEKNYKKFLNMKFVAVLVVAIFSASCVKSDNDMMMKVVQACSKTTGASEEDLQKFLKDVAPETKTQKCMYSCVMIGCGIVSNQKLNSMHTLTNLFSKIKDDKLNKEGFSMMVEMLIGKNPEDMKNALKVFEICEKINESDPCETSTKIGACLKSEGSKYNLKLSF